MIGLSPIRDSLLSKDADLPFLSPSSAKVIKMNVVVYAVFAALAFTFGGNYMLSAGIKLAFISGMSTTSALHIGIGVFCIIAVPQWIKIALNVLKSIQQNQLPKKRT